MKSNGGKNGQFINVIHNLIYYSEFAKNGENVKK